MSRNWTLEDVNRSEARHCPQAPHPEGVERESKLHQEILDDCRARGWLALHSRMDVPATLTVGAPDFVILADGGRVFLIEGKAKGKKLSSKQASLHAWAARLGHRVFTVYSVKEYLECVNDVKP